MMTALLPAPLLYTVGAVDATALQPGMQTWLVLVVLVAAVSSSPGYGGHYSGGYGVSKWQHCTGAALYCVVR